MYMYCVSEKQMNNMIAMYICCRVLCYIKWCGCIFYATSLNKFCCIHYLNSYKQNFSLWSICKAKSAKLLLSTRLLMVVLAPLLI